MLRFALFGFPVVVDWWFWVMCVLLGGGINAHGREDWTLVGIWTVVVFISILVHELGHAVAGQRFGAEPRIKLHGFGGTTFLPGGLFSRVQSIIVSAAGPMAGLLLGAILYLLARNFNDVSPALNQAFVFGLYINFFWTFLNLLPIQPLDGGQIFRDILGPNRLHISRAIGFVLAAALCAFCVWKGELFLAIMLGFLAYHNLRNHTIEGGVVGPHSGPGSPL